MDTIAEVIRTTRKPHKCWGCAKVYPAKTKMKYIKTVDNGDFVGSYWCKTCEDFLDTLSYWDKEDGFLMGDLLNYDHYPERVTSEVTG